MLVGALDSTVSYNSKDELPMKIFSPFAGFLCVVAAFLLILLFVGVVSETGQPQVTAASVVASSPTLCTRLLCVSVCLSMNKISEVVVDGFQ